MKKLYALSAAAVMFFAGCGGGPKQQTSTTTASQVNSIITGVVEASYLKGVKVCVKGTTTCAITDNFGKFRLNAKTPAVLEVRVGNSVIGDVSVATPTITITPAVLANGDKELASYIGAMLHKMAGCEMNAQVCDLSRVRSVDVEPNINKPIVEELRDKVKISDGNITILVNNNPVVIETNDVTTYSQTSPALVESKKVNYHGFVAGEGILHFTYDVATKSLEYKVLSDDGIETATAPITPFYGDIFYKVAKSKNISTDEYVMLSNSMAFGVFFGDKNAHYSIALQYPDCQITSDEVKLIANKRFNTITFGKTGEDVDFGLIDINTTNPEDLNGTWSRVTSSGMDSGVWRVSNNQILLYEDGKMVAYAFLKPGDRAAIIYNETEGGFGIGLESKPLTSDELQGTFFYDNVHVDGDDVEHCFGKVEINGDLYTYQDEICDMEKKSGAGRLELNPEINGYTLNGIARVLDINGNPTNKYIIFDSTDGYFIGIDTDDATISIGSNKPVN